MALPGHSARPALRVPMRDRVAQMHCGDVQRVDRRDRAHPRPRRLAERREAGLPRDAGERVHPEDDLRPPLPDRAGWRTLGRGHGRELGDDGGVTWDGGAAPAFAVNGEPLHRSRVARWTQRREGWNVGRMAREAAGVSYHTIRRTCVRHDSTFHARRAGRTVRAAPSGANGATFRRTDPMDPRWLRECPPARERPATPISGRAASCPIGLTSDAGPPSTRERVHAAQRLPLRRLRLQRPDSKRAPHRSRLAQPLRAGAG